MISAARITILIGLAFLCAVLTSCGGGGPSRSDIEEALVGTTLATFDGNFEIESVSKIDRGSSFETDSGIKVFPIKATVTWGEESYRKLSQLGIEPLPQPQAREFLYYFYEDEFGSWKWERK